MKSLIIILGSALALIGCSSTASFYVDQPAEILIPRNVGLVAQQVNTQGDLDLQFFEPNRILGILGNSVVNNVALSSSDFSQFNTQFKNELNANLKSIGIYQLSIKNAKAIQLNTDINFKVVDKGSSKEFKNSEGILVTLHTLDRSTYADFSLNFVNAQNQIIATKSFSLSTSSQSKGANSGEALNTIPHWKDGVNRLMKEGAYKVAKALAPSRQLVKVKLQDADSDELEEANDLAEDGKWASALTTWKANLNNSKTKEASLHNIGVYHESRQEFDEALLKYDQCRPTKYCESGYQRVNHRISALKAEQAISSSKPELVQPKSLAKKNKPVEPSSSSINQIEGDKANTETKEILNKIEEEAEDSSSLNSTKTSNPSYRNLGR